MQHFVILSKINPEVLEDGAEFREIAHRVADRIRKECPGVKWKDSYATLGRFDVVDIVEAEDAVQVEKAALIIRAEGHAITETLLGRPWKEFIASL